MRGAAVVLTVVTALTLGAGPPAAAETAPDPHTSDPSMADPNITDPCGDADTVGQSIRIRYSVRTWVSCCR